jgi:hydroxymethylbilane synthase
MEKQAIRIGTRGSELALVQTEIFMKEFSSRHHNYKFEVVKISTKGDQIKDSRFDPGFYKGYFTRELEVALINNKIDAAVHSLKDLPSQTDDNLTLSCFLRRGPIHDCIILNKTASLDKPITLGTSSLRRKYFLSLSYPHLKIKPLKGNITTRIEKLECGEYDSICLAKAGLERLDINLDRFNIVDIDQNILPPSPCQGIIAAQTRSNDPLTIILENLSDHESKLMAQVERSFLLSIGAGCNYPLGAISTIEKDQVTLRYWLAQKNLPIKGVITGTFDAVIAEIEKTCSKYKDQFKS